MRTTSDYDHICYCGAFVKKGESNHVHCHRPSTDLRKKVIEQQERIKVLEERVTFLTFSVRDLPAFDAPPNWSQEYERGFDAGVDRVQEFLRVVFMDALRDIDWEE